MAINQTYFLLLIRAKDNISIPYSKQNIITSSEYSSIFYIRRSREEIIFNKSLFAEEINVVSSSDSNLNDID